MQTSILSLIFFLFQEQEKQKKKSKSKKKKKKKIRMDGKPEEIALLEKKIGKELLPANGHFRYSPKVQFTCPTPPEEELPSQTTSKGGSANHSNLRRKISRSASHIPGGFAHNFDDRRSSLNADNNLGIMLDGRKISSSDGDMCGRMGPSDAFLKTKPCANGPNQGSIFDIAYPAVPPLRQTSINPGQKVAQVC